MWQVCVDPGVICGFDRNIGHVSGAGGVGVFQGFWCETDGGSVTARSTILINFTRNTEPLGTYWLNSLTHVVLKNLVKAADHPKSDCGESES